MSLDVQLNVLIIKIDALAWGLIFSHITIYIYMLSISDSTDFNFILNRIFTMT